MAKGTTARRRWNMLVAVFVWALGAGCGDDGAAPPPHPWIRPPHTHDEDAVTLPPFLVYRVDAGKRAEAVAELEREPYVQISPGMASYYVGHEVRVPAEMRPFLVRAVAAPGAAITVVQSLQGLWIRADRHAPGEPVPTPLVVLLDPTPREIFVTVE